jgi:hypothetical protein
LFLWREIFLSILIFIQIIQAVGQQSFGLLIFCAMTPCSFVGGKVKLSLYRPWRPLGLREDETPTFSDIQPTDGVKVVKPYAPAAFYPQEDSWYSFLLEAESTPGRSATGRIRKIEKKNPPHSGLEPTTFQLVA